jgi:hypothetical protein
MKDILFRSKVFFSQKEKVILFAPRLPRIPVSPDEEPDAGYIEGEPATILPVESDAGQIGIRIKSTLFASAPEHLDVSLRHICLATESLDFLYEEKRRLSIPEIFPWPNTNMINDSTALTKKNIDRDFVSFFIYANRQTIFINGFHHYLLLGIKTPYQVMISLDCKMPELGALILKLWNMCVNMALSDSDLDETARIYNVLNLTVREQYTKFYKSVFGYGAERLSVFYR